jgi:16S rRNA (adenine1518-N6/adenine1519-N6)-dimethyltransferase
VPPAGTVLAMEKSLPPLRDVISRYGLRAKKKLGQNFLFDLNLTGKIVRVAGDISNTTVIEIGPGPGGLTRALLAAGAKKVVAIEHDPRCREALTEIADAYPGQLEIIEGDALKIDLAEIAIKPRQIVANLPYNIATPLLINWLRQINNFDKLTLMFQKEVADRITATPKSKAYGRLSVISQWLCHCEHEFNVSKDAFTPPPKVTSTVISLTPRKAPLADASWDSLEKVTAAAFGQRRKMLRSSLKSLNLDFDALQIKETVRAEELSVEQFCAIARAVT